MSDTDKNNNQDYQPQMNYLPNQMVQVPGFNHRALPKKIV